RRTLRREGSGDEGPRHRRARPRLARDRDPAESSRQTARLPARSGEEACGEDRPARCGREPHTFSRAGDRIRRRRIRARASGPRGEPRAARGVAARAGETMKLVTASQMRVIEQRAIEAGISIAELMEAAGLAVAQEAWLALGLT